eukprot:3219263-Ditylum_brightwellii.AAC.1
MMMLMVTGAKSPTSSPFTSSNLVTPAKSATTVSINTASTTLTTQTEEDDLEKKITAETVLYGTVMHMHTSPLPDSIMPESEEAQINKI